MPSRFGMIRGTIRMVTKEATAGFLTCALEEASLAKEPTPQKRKEREKKLAGNN
jgi:hypothetical protein